MKRDMSLIKAILKWVEANGQYGGRFSVIPSLPGYEDNDVQYHADLCEQAGYFTAVRSQGGVLVQCLTWAGHEALDALRRTAD